ncbi:MAG: GNAT family N-acetyltransferase [Candidatus Eisenbacteria bacterium]
MAGSLPSVLVLYNEPRPGGSFGHALSDAGVLAEAEAVAEALRGAGVPHRVASVRTLRDVPDALLGGEEKIVFNLVESLHGDPEQAALVPAVSEAFGRSCTGSGTDALLLTLDKGWTKGILRGAGLPVPPGVTVPPGESVPAAGLPPGTLIVKPVRADASEGITAEKSVCPGPGPRLDEAVRSVHERFGGAALVEALVGERELNVSLLQRGNEITVLPLAEIDFGAFAEGKPRIVDYAAKWEEGSFEFHHTPRLLPAPLAEEDADRVRAMARAAWFATGCRDYARVDFRLGEGGEPFILEINANPDIAPDAGFAAALAAGDVPFARFVLAAVRNAADRLPPPAAVPRRSGKPEAAGIEIRRTTAPDREGIIGLLRATRFFRDNEVDIAIEVLDEAIEKGEGGHYRSYTALREGRPTGWVSFGPTPCTSGTWDLYWIAVSPEEQGTGVGSMLMELAERLIAESSGRLVIVETAGREEYEPTRRFYLKLAYTEASRLKDFYAPGDDKVVYTKVLDPRS